MPVFLAMCRMAQCVICDGQWTLDGVDTPATCIHCGSKDWEFGIESIESRYIRQRIQTLKKVLNPGAVSKKRQDWGRKQWRQFKPKPVEQD